MGSGAPAGCILGPEKRDAIPVMPAPLNLTGCRSSESSGLGGIRRVSTNPSVHESQDAQEILPDFSHAILSGVVVRDRIAYRKAAHDGLCVDELKPKDSKASEEIGAPLPMPPAASSGFRTTKSPRWPVSASASGSSTMW
jgi:hypothetical protein